MTQDQPPLPEPPQDEPQPSPTSPESPEELLIQRSSEAAREPLPQTVQRLWSQTQPRLKAQTIKALKATIQVLEGVVATLEAEPPPRPTNQPLPPSASTSEPTAPPTSNGTPGNLTPAFSTTELLDKLQAQWQRIEPTWQTLWQRIEPIWRRFQPWWAEVLRQIRSRLPNSFNETLSDRALTGIIAGLAIVLLWTTSALFSGQSQPAEVAVVPSPQPSAPIESGPESQPASPEVAAPASPQPIEVSPIPVVVSPAPLQPSPTPTPPLKLTPEQTLIAAIQDQVAEISNRYVNGLIQSVQANFRSSRLILKAGEGWYELERSQQDKLANEMLRRAQELDFSKLEITDPDGNLLARSPVVGSEMVIVKRTTELSPAI